MPKYTLPIGYEIASLKADINERCHVSGTYPFTVEYLLESYANPETRTQARFKLMQMCMTYTSILMNQFTDMQRMVSHATLSMQLVELLVKTTRNDAA